MPRRARSSRWRSRSLRSTRTSLRRSQIATASSSVVPSGKMNSEESDEHEDESSSSLPLAAAADVPIIVAFGSSGCIVLTI